MEDPGRDFVLRPAPNAKFRSSVAKSIVEETLRESLVGETFNPTTSDVLSNNIAASIRERLKGLHLSRYKYVVQVIIGENRGQGVHVVSECVWDMDSDGMASAHHTQNNLWCQATVFAIFTY